MALQDLTPQLRTRLGKVEWSVGLFLSVTALLMLAGFGYFLKHTADTRGWFITEVPYYTYLQDAVGIHKGSPVNMMGFKAGEVTVIEPLDFEARKGWDYYITNNYNVFVGFKIREKYAGYIGADSRVRVGGFPIEIAGGSTLEITTATPNSIVTLTNLPDGKPGVLWEKFAYDFDPAKRKYGALTNGQKGYYLRLEQAETLVAQAQRILVKVDAITAKLDAALPGITSELTNTLATTRQAIAGATNDLQASLGTLRSALPGLTNELQKVLVGVNATTAQVRDTIPGLTNDLHLTLVSVRELLDDTNGPIRTMAGDVRTTLTNVNVLLTRDTNVLANVSNLASNANSTVNTLHGGLRRLWPFSKAAREARAKEAAPPKP